MGNQGSSSLPQQKYPPRSGEDSKVRSMEFRRQRSDQGDKQQKLYQPPNHKPMYWRILCNMINFCTMKWYLLRTRADWIVSIILYREKNITFCMCNFKKCYLYKTMFDMVKPPEEINSFQILTNEDWIWFQNYMYMYIFVMYM